MVNAHAGVKTGEDGPTHADPQAAPAASGVLPGERARDAHPWDALEIWPLLLAGLRTRPRYWLRSSRGRTTPWWIARP